MSHTDLLTNASFLLGKIHGSLHMIVATECEETRKKLLLDLYKDLGNHINELYYRPHEHE